MAQDGHRLVHLDMKGAAPRPSYLEQIFPLLQRMGATGLLIEYEDMFPYWGELACLKSKFAYSEEDVRHILRLALDNNLMVIPLVQTFGHMEFVLKHGKFAHLREVKDTPMALCPSNQGSMQLVCQMLEQVMALHPASRWFHIGCDEVYHLAFCQTCKDRLMEEQAYPIQLFYSHVKSVAQFVSRRGENVTPIIWDDMLRLREAAELKASSLGGMVELMVWHYLPVFQLPPDLWARLSDVFPAIWVASSFKGSTSVCASFTNIHHHISNQLAWLSVISQELSCFRHFRGIAITGWQRFDHYAVLCELLPEGLPSLALCLGLLCHKEWTPSVHIEASKLLNFAGLIPLDVPFGQPIPACDFPGSFIYTCITEYAALNVDYRENVYGEKVFTWMNPYNLQRKNCNPLHVESISNYLYLIMIRLQDLRGRLMPALENVYYPNTCEEWISINLDPKIAELNKILVEAESFLACARSEVSPVDPTNQFCPKRCPRDIPLTVCRNVNSSALGGSFPVRGTPPPWNTPPHGYSSAETAASSGLPSASVSMETTDCQPSHGSPGEPVSDQVISVAELAASSLEQPPP